VPDIERERIEKGFVPFGHVRSSPVVRAPLGFRTSGARGRHALCSAFGCRPWQS
jgi:hypothetical protein